MSNSKLCILTCCIGVSLATFVTAQPAASGSDDQEKALQALRQAEATPLEQPAVTPKKARKKAKKVAKEATPAVVQTAPVDSAPAAITEEQRQALQALRQAEAGPAVADQTAPTTPAPAVAPAPAAAPAPVVEPAPAVASAPAVAPAPVVASSSPAPTEDQSKALEALRHAEAEPVVSAQTTPSASAAPDKAAQKAADAAARKKAQEDVARRVQQLKKDMQNAPAPAQASAAPSSGSTEVMSAKEQKLADLLRRYQADEITPYQYHMERAKIIAEP